MKIIIDPRAGFCPGVKRVISLAEEELSRQKKLFALGEIIHNRSETGRLERLGLQIVDHALLQEAPPRDVPVEVLIRAHGEPPQTYQLAEQTHWRIVDGTCPIVKRSQRMAEKYARQGYEVLVVGKKQHPEVVGILGFCHGRGRAVLTEDDLHELDPGKKYFVLAQTTIAETVFRNIVRRLQEKRFDIIVRDTICGFVRGRDRQVVEFARQCDAVLVVGGKHSSNTRVLYQICWENNPRTFWIEEPGEIDPTWFKESDTVGITGGASTPQWLLEEVRKRLETIFAPAQS